MPAPGEHKTVQARILQYAQDIGWRGDRPLHVVAAYNARDDEHIVITVYEPDAAQWDDGFRRRKQ